MGRAPVPSPIIGVAPLRRGGPPLLRFGATSPPAHGFGATNRSGRSSTTAANRFRAPFLAQMGELATKAKTLS